jgi:virulence-associated protein VagC
MSTAQLDQRSTVPKDYEFHLNELEIRENGNQVILTFPKRDWKEAMARQEQKAKSTDTTVNLEPVMKKMKGQMVIKIVNTAAEQVLTTRPDPRDAIPLTYCDKTRRIVALVGFIVSTATIFGVQTASVADLVPGFQPLHIFTRDEGNLGGTQGQYVGTNVMMFVMSTLSLVGMVTMLACLFTKPGFE